MNLSLPIRMAHELHFYGLQLIISKGLNMKRQFVLFALLLMVLLPVGARAQEVASLTGVVTDPSGAVLPDVTVKLQDSKTGTRYETKTNSDGGYTFARLLPGPGYRLELSKEGFETTAISNIYVRGYDAYPECRNADREDFRVRRSFGN